LNRRQFTPQLNSVQLFALIFTAIFLLHAPLLRLPYFWDEAGYYIPAAYDLLTTGTLIPHSVPSNAHPPLPSIYLELWWKISAFKPAVTRIAMLLVAAFGLSAVLRLGRLVAATKAAMAAVALTAIYPVWFAQSSLAHSDLLAASLSLWGMFFYFRSLLGRPASADGGPILTSKEEAALVKRRARKDLFLSIGSFTIAALAKETAIIVPLSLAVYDAGAYARARRSSALRWRPLLMLLAGVPLCLWFVYHRYRTGFFFGNPEYFSYNVSGTLKPLRILLAIGVRLWQVLGYMNMWVLTLATVWAMRYPALAEKDASERPRIALAVQYRIAAILLGNITLFSVLGGAALARYLLVAYPLVVLIGVSTLRRRLQEWTWITGIVAAGFVLALFAYPLGFSAPEDNLGYRNYVVLHKEAASRLQAHYAHARVLTAWPASDELTKPFLGYVRQPLQIVRVEDFSYPNLQLATAAAGEFDVALLFSTKPEPGASLLDRWGWWERVSSRYFGFHRDLPPSAAARMLGGQIVWQERKGNEWIAIVSFERVQNARDQAPIDVLRRAKPALKN